MPAKKSQCDAMILLFKLTITLAFAECQHELERLFEYANTFNMSKD